MGEVAEMMLDGTLCEGCGVFLNAVAPGYPCYCSKQCRGDRGADDLDCDGYPPPAAKIPCPLCGKKVKPTGLVDHKRVVHGITK